jgi:hypothetical protein
MNGIVHITRVSPNGTLPKRISDEIRNYFSFLKNKPVEIKIRKVSSKRSLEQNSYLHLMFSIITEALNEQGNTFLESEIKGALKLKFLLIEVYNEATGELLSERVRDTSELSVGDMAIFIEQCIQWSAERNIIVPPPLTQTELEYEN